jgi:hypothetical protein
MLDIACAASLSAAATDIDIRSKDRPAILDIAP